MVIHYFAAVVVVHTLAFVVGIVLAICNVYSFLPGHDLLLQRKI